MSLATPSKIRELQIKLYRKAKNEPGYRFYLLYDKIYREDILAHAYALARANKGVPGVDGQTFERIESAGLGEWLTGIRQELRNKTYQPQPGRRVMIPKPGSGERPLGIPTIRDRVVQTAAKMVLEPIFEADLEPSAYGYRPKRSAQDAIRKVGATRCNPAAPAASPEKRCSANWEYCRFAAPSWSLVREFAVKPVGKPDAGNPHVRFDERGWETGRRSGVSARAHPRLYKLARRAVMVRRSQTRSRD